MNISIPTDLFNCISKYSLYSGSIIVFFGIFGNLLNILVFTQLKFFRRNQCAFYLTIESISNILFLFYVISLNIFIWIYTDDATESFLIWCKLRFIFAQAFLFISYSMICCLAVDQYFSTNHCLYLRQLCTVKLARSFTYTFVSLWIGHSILFGCFFDIQPIVGCVISNYIYHQYVTYFVYPILLGLLPILLSSFFSFLAFRNVRRIIQRRSSIIRRRLDRQTTAIVFTRVIIFVCLGIPHTSFRIYSLNTSISRTKTMEFAIEQLLQTIFTSLISLNFSVSFYAFLILSSRFRRQVKSVLIRKCWKQWKHVCCPRDHLVFPQNQLPCQSNMQYEGHK